VSESFTLEQRYGQLRALCERLQSLEALLSGVANRLRFDKTETESCAAAERTQPTDLIGRFGDALEFAFDRMTAIDYLAARIDVALGAPDIPVNVDGLQRKDWPR
jgi:hypothetical protein